MRKKVTNLDDIISDGARIVIDWDKFEVGTSFFLPCIDIRKARYSLNNITGKKGWKITTRYRVEGDMAGLRVWRCK